MATAAPASGRRIRQQATTLAARLPSLVVAARQRRALRCSTACTARRQAGPGETFWQFRPFVSGEPAARVDWRRSAREDRAFVREREWEASHTVWIWFDRSASMAFASDARAVRQDRPRRRAGARAGGSWRCAGASAPASSASPARWRRAASSSASPRRSPPTSVCAALRRPACPRPSRCGRARKWR